MTEIVLTEKVFTINPFAPNAPFSTSLKTSENLTVFWYFQGVEKGCIGNEYVKKYLVTGLSIPILSKYDLNAAVYEVK